MLNFNLMPGMPYLIQTHIILEYTAMKVTYYTISGFHPTITREQEVILH